MASDTIYDHPRYYDLLFAFDRGPEAAFYHETFARCGVPSGARVLEVAAGPARVGRLLARRGWRVTALDRSAAMLAYARAAAAETGTPLATLLGDMTEFSAREPFSAACNPLSSFRILQCDADVDAHLRRMAEALVPGGVYAIDFAIGTPEGHTTDEEWEMTSGALTVRGGNEGVTVREGGRELRLTWGAGPHLRSYAPAALAERVAACRELTIESWHAETRGPGGATGFSREGTREPPAEGRVMVVLRRR